MSYFDYLCPEEKEALFFRLPAKTLLTTNRETLAYALGATLYIPASAPKILDKFFNSLLPGLISTIVCLEDAVSDQDVVQAEHNLIHQLTVWHKAKEKEATHPPFIFVRVRNLEQMKRILTVLGSSLTVLTGFVFPKFEATDGWRYFEELKRVNEFLPRPLYGMPILEDFGTIRSETRVAHLLKIKDVLDAYRDLTLNIRIGATDLCGHYGIRRSPEFTIYDIVVIKECIADIVNIFSRPEADYVISGPVWEYFFPGSRVLKSQLRQSPFQEQYGASGLQLRQKLVHSYIDGLIKEVMLDKVNGLIGKTVIHPKHITLVQALHVVTHEEYSDAADIVRHNRNGGVLRSAYNNKMNEVRPHARWAKKIMTMSEIYGVLKEGYDYIHIIHAKENL
ncbi:HpcH/HpaI aldolase/citrate lyase family protein [Thermodesulfovibrionales bacterium]|nr:HpcH/HpaI aldolase/citrate lyase family protein [Thermodesulfovibrionales bacterium]MCL0042141.1 HpcH/HpaI aldolase/citrate lyase family protein [Thermodesulfovibrionales bacterium]MCL0051486.1 HpcH/HpaI aldolase/citrate lyase family protein [Thermodesulfovibrionales bacterium]